MQFRVSKNVVSQELQDKYVCGGYCVINAMVNLLNANGGNIDIDTMQKRAMFFIDMVQNDYELFKNVLKDFYKDNEKYEWVQNAEDFKFRQSFNWFKKYYSSKKRIGCMNGNVDWLVWLLFKNLGYKIKWINKQLHPSDIENLGKIYGNFAISLSGHCSSFVNGELVDFYNPFSKISGWDAEKHDWKRREARKLVEYIVYKDKK